MSSENNSIIKIFEDVDASASFNSNAFDIAKADASSLQCGNIASSNLTGSMKIQVCNEPSLGWNDLPNSTQAFAKVSAIGISNIWDLSRYGFAKFRFVWTYTSGSGTLTGVLNSKG